MSVHELPTAPRVVATQEAIAALKHLVAVMTITEGVTEAEAPPNAHRSEVEASDPA